MVLDGATMQDALMSDGDVGTDELWVTLSDYII